MTDEYLVTYHCAFCGEENETFVDPSAGSRQTYVEDCTVCCRPNVIHAAIDPGGNVSLTVEPEE